jgi:hypothetical protein
MILKSQRGFLLIAAVVVIAVAGFIAVSIPKSRLDHRLARDHPLAGVPPYPSAGSSGMGIANLLIHG